MTTLKQLAQERDTAEYALDQVRDRVAPELLCDLEREHNAIPHLLRLLEEAKKLLAVRELIDAVERPMWEADARGLVARITGDIEVEP